MSGGSWNWVCYPKLTQTYKIPNPLRRGETDPASSAAGHNSAQEGLSHHKGEAGVPSQPLAQAPSQQVPIHSSRSIPIAQPLTRQMQENDMYSSSLASVSSYATQSAEESDDTDAETSESDTLDSQTHNGSMAAEAQVPPPFLYPVPHTIAEQVQAGPAGSATPRAPTFSAAHSPGHTHMQGPTYVPSPVRTTFSRAPVQYAPSQRGIPRRTPMSSQAPTPKDVNVGDYFALGPRQMQKLSAMSQGHRPETGPDSVPLTPSAIAFRRSSTVGMPMMWMTSHSNAASAVNTPTAANFGQRTPSTATHPSMYFAAPGHGLSSMHSNSRDSSPRISRLPKLESSSLASNFQLDPAPAGPLWKRRMEYKQPSKTVYGFPSKDDELAEEQEHAEQEAAANMQDTFSLRLRKNTTPLDSRRSSWQKMSPAVVTDGTEKLPPYNCTVHIEGFLPRKMELTAPGQPARERGWESYYFVLHGTAMHVYKTDISLLYNKSVSPEVIWGLAETTHVHTTPLNESLHDDELAHDEEQDKRDAVAHSNATGLEVLLSKSLDVKSFSSSVLSSSAPHERHVKVPAANQAEYEEQIRLVRKSLQEHRIHSYPMERAQCGLAADYTKRQHVVRMKIAGEQFLIQTRNNFHMVDWIEAIQASANICMDLDTRPMPSFVTLPRRRRRRHGGEAVSLNQHAPTARAVAS